MTRFSSPHRIPNLYLMSFVLSCPNCGPREVTDFGFGGEVSPRPATRPPDRELNALRVLPPQRRRSAARVVAAPLRLPGLVPGRTRHAHERRALDRAAGRRPALTRLDPQPGERIDRSQPDHVHVRRRPRVRLRRRHDRLRALRRRAPRVLAIVQVPPPARRAVRVRPVRELALPRRRRTRRARVRRAGARGDARDAPERVAVAAVRRRCASPTASAARSRRSASTTRRSSRPRRLWPLYEKVLRSAAGLGRLPAHQDEREWETEYRRRHCDVLVIGGGIAGLSAATRAAELGADVVLCDEDAVLGGRSSPKAATSGPDGSSSARRDAGVELLTGAAALGFFDGLVPVWQGSMLHQVRAGEHIVATGALQQPLVFPDNDLPGVMLSGGARRLAALYAVKPGRARGRRHGRRSRARRRARAAGRRRRRGRGRRPARRRRHGGGAPRGRRHPRADRRHRRPGARAQGRRAGGQLARVDARGRARDGGETLACDLLAVSGGSAPALLAAAAGRRAGPATTIRASREPSLPTELPAGVRAAGAVAGHAAGAEAAERSAPAPRARPSSAPGSAVAAPVATPPAYATRRAPRRKRVRRPRRGRHGQGHRARRAPRAMTRSSSPSATRR